MIRITRSQKMLVLEDLRKIEKLIDDTYYLAVFRVARLGWAQIQKVVLNHRSHSS